MGYYFKYIFVLILDALKSVTSEEIQTLEAPELRRRSAIIVNILRENIAVCKRILLEKFQGNYSSYIGNISPTFFYLFSFEIYFYLFRYPMRCSRKIEPKHLCCWILVGKMSSRRRIIIFYHQTRSSGKAKNVNKYKQYITS